MSPTILVKPLEFDLSEEALASLDAATLRVIRTLERSRNKHIARTASNFKLENEIYAVSINGERERIY